MKRDMDLVRLILLKVEDEYVSTPIFNLCIEGYDPYGDHAVWGFRVGALPWSENDYLEKIRNDSIWEKTKNEIVSKGLPMVFETIKTISTSIITAITEGAVNSIIKNN